MTRTWLALMTLVALGGCDLYFGGGDDTVCNGGAVDGYPSSSYRDPATATCIPGYGGGYCDDKCGPCPAYDLAQPDMGLCESSCSGLTEGTCQTTTGCYAAYSDDPAFDGKRNYEGCWQVAPSGPVHGACMGLDAHECSRHDDCSLLYSSSSNTASRFISCLAEPSPTCNDDTDCGSGAHCEITSCGIDPNCPSCPTCGQCAEVCAGVCVPDSPSCAAVDCGPGYHCEEQCYPTDGPNGPVMGWCNTACVPDASTCASLDCGPGYKCTETCEMTGNGTLWCGAVCTPTNTGPGSCYGQVACDALPPACPTGTTPGRTASCWTGYCIPNADCGPNDPGDCYGNVLCDAVGPACPVGTTPGIANGCYTGYCIPESQCTAQACETLSSEAACGARSDCTAIYTGTDCTCTPNGCTCSTLTWNRCETAYMPL